jgi:pimeloyl-ACP methyl ester carboxylesterase
MPLNTTTRTFRALDGTQLTGTLVVPDGVVERAVVFVHGGGVTREEGGFFTRLAAGLGEAGVASLRYDLRAHGDSEGRREEVTLSAHLNDLRVALAEVRQATGAAEVSVLGASFGGGLCAYYAAKRGEDITRLVLLNPQLDYKDRYVDQKSHWVNESLTEEAADHLTRDGFVRHSPTVIHGRALLNEVFWIRPITVVEEITAPTLIVHGTKDTFVSIEASRAAAQRLRAEYRLVEVEGAQHGFAVHDDPEYAQPQTQDWQAFVIRTVIEWITTRT